MNKLGLTACAALAFAGLAITASTPARSQYCEGTVHGLSGRYNLAAGSGFLAVRARPNASSRMVGQLFNGNTAEILDRKGNWYVVSIGGIEGWANRKWVWNSCNY